MEMERLTELRALVCDDPVAVQKWPTVVDHIVKSATDRRRIKKAFFAQEEEAVLQSLQIWNGHGSQRVDLLKVLRCQGLNLLADNIVAAGILPETEPGPETPHGSGTKDGQAKSVWFEVGELVYNFTGRQSELESLHKMMTSSHSTESCRANLVSICGLGGIGKSALARKYAFKYRDEYSGNVVWVNAETVDSMRASFIRLANRLGVPTSEQDSNQDISRKVYETFQNQKSLFIFDNVEENSHVKQFLPRIDDPNNQAPFLLVTTRRNDIALLPGNQLNLDVLEMEEAASFIRKLLPCASENDAEKLAETLQRLPLALQQALAYIKDAYTSNGDCISKYLKEFQAYQRKLLDDERFKENSDYSRTTFTTWTITLSRIERLDRGHLAIRAIEALACLNPDFISEQFVSNIFEDESQAERGLKLLELFSMISVLEGKIAIHRLVQKVVRLSMNSEQEIPVLKSVMRVIQLQFVKNLFTDYTRECMSHGLHFFPFQVDHSELMKEISDYLNVLCYFLQQYGNYSDALSTAQRSASMYESMVGNEHEDTILMKWRTAEAHHCLCDYSDAMKLFESILPIAKSKLGQEDGLTLSILQSMARTDTEMGDHQKAIKIYDEIIPVLERMNGENNVNVLGAKNSKANALRRCGRVDEALERFQYVYEKLVELHGEHDLRTLDVRECIGYVFYDKGDLGKAIEIWTEVYETYKQVVGETHPGTIRTKKNIETATAIANAELIQIK